MLENRDVLGGSSNGPHLPRAPLRFFWVMAACRWGRDYTQWHRAGIPPAWCALLEHSLGPLEETAVSLCFQKRKPQGLHTLCAYLPSTGEKGQAQTWGQMPRMPASSTLCGLGRLDGFHDLSELPLPNL